MYKVGIIGDRDSVLGFGAVGIEPVIVDNSDFDACKDALKECVGKNCAVIFVTEPVAVTIADEIDKYSDEPIPAIIILPDNKGGSGVGMANIKKSVERAVGADILG